MSAEQQPPGQKSQLIAYRELAREALERVTACNNQAERWTKSGETQIALEYRQQAQEALAAAQRYKALADLVEKQDQRGIDAARQKSGQSKG